MPNKDDDKAKGQGKPGAVDKQTKPAASKGKVSQSKALGTAKKPENPASVKTTKVTSKTPKSAELAQEAPAPKSAVGAATAMSALVPSPASTEIRGTVLKVAAGVLGVIIVVLIVFGVLIYGYKSEDPAVKAVAQIVPYPVELVNGQFVSYKDYLFEVDANETAYQNNAKLNNEPPVDFSSTSGKKLAQQIKQHVLQQLEQEALVAQLAHENGVTVTKKQVDNVVSQLASRNGGQATLLKVLKQTYGWSLSDLRGVVYKELLQQNLETKITSAPSVQSAAEAKANDVLRQINAGADFSSMAKKYSQASDASSGGDLGYVSKSQLPVQEQSVVESLQPGNVSNVIKTQYGFDIIKVLDKKSDGTIHVQHILIEPVDFNQYFETQMRKAKVTKYINA